jgi:pyruvate-formate lyase-activating enzyme
VIDRRRLYRFPWSKSDNAGGWVEVTDECTLSCPGCYRHKIEGQRPLDAVKHDILECQQVTNCDGMAIAGGEPLIYPYIIDVVGYMSGLGIKPTILSNGEKLTPALARELKKAGLAKIHLHIDSAQKRPGWEGKNEAELNELRQHYADLLWKTKGIQCGFHVTVFRNTLGYLPEITAWCKKNIPKVQHISFIAFRTLPVSDDIEYFVDGKKIDLRGISYIPTEPNKIGITTEEMFERIKDRHIDFEPASYLNGSSNVETFKYLINVYVGSKKMVYGVLGARTVELVQVFYHFFKGRYLSFLKRPVVGKKLFCLALFDQQLRRTLRNYAQACLRNPLHLISKIYTQSIHLHQPNELMGGQINLCDSCLNMMVHKGRLINSCRLDEYRIFGSAVSPVEVKQ